MVYKNDLIHLKRVRLKRLTYNHSVTKPVNMTHCKWWNSCIVIQHTFSSSDYGIKHNLSLFKELVMFRLAYCLSVLNMDWNHDSRMEMK